MKHHLLIGTWTPPGAIFTICFDDADLSLTLVKRTEIPKDEPISWMTLSTSRKTLYGAGMKKWNSFAVPSPVEVIHQGSHPMGTDPQANSSETRTRAIFVLAAKLPPHNVYGNPFYEHAGQGNVFSTDASTGALKVNIQNYDYAPTSAIHGMVFNAAETHLYSADMWANRIWTHAKDPSTGLLKLAGSVEAPAPNDHPRWVEIAPSGKFLYVLMESGNRLCVYSLSPQTHLPEYTGRSYPLVPPGMAESFPKMYRSDVTFLSCSGRYLFATSRSNSPSLTGYIAAFALSESGAVERQICLNPTPTSGGHSNAVSPCPWSDEWVALCDDEKGFVEIYRWREEFLGRVAHLDVKEPGFGMNAVWWD